MLRKSLKACFMVVWRNLRKNTYLRLDNSCCARNDKEKYFSVLVRAENSFQLHILEALCIQLLRPTLFKQKKFVYQTRLFKSLY